MEAVADKDIIDIDQLSVASNLHRQDEQNNAIKLTSHSTDIFPAITSDRTLQYAEIYNLKGPWFLTSNGKLHISNSKRLSKVAVAGDSVSDFQQ